MTDEKLHEELQKLLGAAGGPYLEGTRYFDKGRILKKDRKIYKRRTFRDLFHHFRFNGVSEVQLMRVLGNPEHNYAAFTCPDIKKAVFYGGAKYEKLGPQRVMFWASQNFTTHFRRIRIQGTKYNKTYLTKLWKTTYGNN